VPHRIEFNLSRILRTEYQIDDVQKCYFVIDDFQRLFDETRMDFTALYEQLKDLPNFKPSDILTDDVLIEVLT
jgi:phenylalanine-4-hydroxylase